MCIQSLNDRSFKPIKHCTSNLSCTNTERLKELKNKNNEVIPNLPTYNYIHQVSFSTKYGRGEKFLFFFFCDACFLYILSTLNIFQNIQTFD